MANQQEQLENFKRKYDSVLSLIKQRPEVRLQNVHVENGKLLIRASVPSDQVKNEIWDQIKRVDASYSDLTADISVDQSLAAAQQPSPKGAGKSYTVKPGDTLSKISKEFYGDPNRYNEIFEANRDQLSDPNKIQAGQTLKIPA